MKSPTKRAVGATVKRGSRPELVYTILRLAILEQALRPGTKLPEDAIGDRLGVSRTVVRRALERLSADELVDLEPNRGASVALPTMEEARDVFAVRTDIERLVVERVCGRLTGARIAVLEACVAREEQAHREGSPDYIRHAAEFHVLLAEMAGSPLLLKYIRSLVGRSALILGLHGRPDWPKCNMDEHRAVIAALRNDEPDRAREAMQVHLDGVLNRALEGWTRQEEPGILDVISAYATAAESG